MPDFILSVHRELLTDGSPVFNVVVYGQGTLVLHAETEDAAYKVAEKIAAAINDHTVDTAEIHWVST